MRPLNGEKLKDLMRLNGMSMEEFAKKIKVKDKSSIAHWCAGDYQPQPRNLKVMAKVLGVEIAELLVAEEVTK